MRILSWKSKKQINHPSCCPVTLYQNRHKGRSIPMPVWLHQRMKTQLFSLHPCLCLVYYIFPSNCVHIYHPVLRYSVYLVNISTGEFILGQQWQKQLQLIPANLKMENLQLPSFEKNAVTHFCFPGGHFPLSNSIQGWFPSCFLHCVILKTRGGSDLFSFLSSQEIF